MPAATSLEDIYHSLAGAGAGASLSASYSPSSNFQLPEFYLRAAAQHLTLHPKLTVAAEKQAAGSGASSQEAGQTSSSKQKQQKQTDSANQNQTHTQNQAQSQNQAQAQSRRKLGASASLAASNSAAQRRAARQLTYQVGRRQRDAMAAGREPHQAPREPLLFVYHDEDLSTASAPDSFFSLGRQQQAGAEEPAGAPAGSGSHHLTIEGLRLALNSCWLCGCNWQQDHVSLDCPECGGYALSRPCANCDGRCRQVWRRNINGSHDYHKALWVGECLLESRQPDCCSAASGQLAASSTEARLRAVELRSDDDSDGLSNESDDDDCLDCDSDDGIQVAFGRPAANCDEK